MRLFNSEAFMRFPRRQRGIGWRRHLPANCPLLYFLGQRGGWLNLVELGRGRRRPSIEAVPRPQMRRSYHVKD